VVKPAALNGNIPLYVPYPNYLDVYIVLGTFSV